MESGKIKRFKIIYLIIAAFLFVTFFFMINKNYSIKAKQNNNHIKKIYKYLDDVSKIRKIKIVAHRGVYFTEPENSIRAIEDSIKYKVNYAEIDVQETKDGMVVLMHDKNLKRLTGLNENVSDLTFKQIEGLNIGSHFKNKNQERIPTLDSVIKASKNKVRLIIEIKPYGNTEDLTKKVVNIIESNDFVNQCMVHSLSYNILLNVKSLNPNIKTGYIACWHRKDLTSLNVDFYSVEQRLITKKLVMKIHKEHKKIYSWTVDKPNNMDNMIKLNVDGIITDKPNILMDVKKGIQL